MCGHRHSTQNTTSYEVTSVDAGPAARPISLLDFPPELVARILLYLSPLDIISCRRTCRILYDLCSNSIFRYLIQMERGAVSDDMNPGLPYPTRLRILEEREEAWATLNFHRSVNIPIPFDWSNYWPGSLTGGVFLLGTTLHCESHQRTMGHSYVTLPSLPDAQDQKFEWKRHNFGTEALVGIQLAVHEHDMIAALTAKEDMHRPSERNTTLELRLLSFSTGQPHPLAQQPVIFIDKKVLPLERRRSQIEIVGDFLILLITFSARSRNQDIFFLVRWKTGLTYSLRSPEKGTYRHFSHLSQDTLVIPNLIQHTLEIAKIVIDNDDIPHFVLLSVLHLPPLIQNVSLSDFYCRAEPNPTGSGPLAVSSRSDRPFHDKAEDAIVIFNMSYDYSFWTQRDWLTLIVHRRALLAHVPAAHRACAPFCSTPAPAPALVEVPWPIWGPPVTRLFVGSPTRMHFVETTSGQRAVMLEDRMPTPIIVRDFNPYAVRAARALASASGQSQQGNWSMQLPNGNRMSLKVDRSAPAVSSIFEGDVWSSLPYVEVVTQGEYEYDGVLMDEARILGFQSRQEDELVTPCFNVHVLG